MSTYIIVAIICVAVALVLLRAWDGGSSEMADATASYDDGDSNLFD